MKYGVFSVSMPEYGIAETADLLKEIGYDGVEWRVNQIPKQLPEQIPFENRYWINCRSTLDITNIAEEARRAKELCDKAGIEIFSLTSYLTPDKTEEIEKILKAAQSIGCGMMRVFTPNYTKSINYRKIFDETLSHTRTLEGLAKKYGVKIVYELHGDNILASPSSACRMVSSFDPRYIGVIFDPGNMIYEGNENYRKGFEMLGEHLAHVHVKNSLWQEEGRDELGSKKWKRAWAPLWDGQADLRELFQVMKDMNYTGRVSVEDFSNEMPTRDKLVQNLAYLKKLQESVGL
ncbi:MAG: sugar phosphate isomerase/epimerase [Provencibacterium sp.]|jgi:sugar phosphate isomerase/epimerase|nr:sugar phosphate isomerase/epimerase [Provencibacterium sp.]